MNNRHKLLMQLNQPKESSLKAVPNRVINQRGFHVIEGKVFVEMTVFTVFSVSVFVHGN